MVKLGPVLEKWNNRHGTKKAPKEKSFLEELGISL